MNLENDFLHSDRRE